MSLEKPCPHCGGAIVTYRNPAPTVDIVIYAPDRGVALIDRSNPPLGWALPGGFVDYGEAAERAAVREAKEETNLDVRLTGVLGVYSDPGRDPRMHTLSVVYTAVAIDPDCLQAGDDAGAARFFPLGQWPEALAFDHRRILGDFQSMILRLNPGG